MMRASTERGTQPWFGRASTCAACRSIVKWPLQVYANDGVPLRFAGVGQLAATDESGIVDQHVEATEGIHRGLDEAACTLPVRDVVPIDDRLAARRSDLVDHLVGRARSDVVHHHVRTFGGESQRVRAPNAAAGTVTTTTRPSTNPIALSPLLLPARRDQKA